MTPPRSTTKSLKRKAAGGTSASGGAKAPKQRQPVEPTGQEAAILTALAEPAGKGKHHIQPQVLEKIRSAGGEPVTLSDLSAILGVPKTAVQHAVLKLTRTVPQIVVVTKGQVWKWAAPEPSNAPITGDFGRVPEPPRPIMSGAQEVLYREIGVSVDGNPIVQKVGESEMYRLEQI